MPPPARPSTTPLTEAPQQRPLQSVPAGPITVSATETLEAIAAAPGYRQRGRLRCVHHNFPADLRSQRRLLHPCGGLHLRAVGEHLRCHLRCDHLLHHQWKTPTTSSAIYAAPITVSATETLEAIAVKSGDTNSAVASAAYTITPPPTVSTPSFTPPAGPILRRSP